MTWEEILAHLGFFKRGNQFWIDPVLYGLLPPLCWVAGFISASAQQDINHPRTVFLLLPLSSARSPLQGGMWPSAARSPTRSPPEELGPQTLPHCILRCVVFQKGGTGPGSTTVPVLRAPRASFPHSLIRLAGSPIWQPRAPIWQPGYLCGGAISGLQRRKWPKCWSAWYSVTPNGALTKRLE